MSDEAEIRAVRAKQLLDDPLFQEALETAERGAVDGLAAVSLTDTQAMIAAVARLQATRQVRSEIEGIALSTSPETQQRPSVA